MEITLVQQWFVETLSQHETKICKRHPNYTTSQLLYDDGGVALPIWQEAHAHSSVIAHTIAYTQKLECCTPALHYIKMKIIEMHEESAGANMRMKGRDVWQICAKSRPINMLSEMSSNMRNTCLFTPGVAGSCRGLILLPSKEGHSPFSSHDDHRVVLKSGKTQPINYSRGQRGQSLAWNWARSYQSAGASEGDICLSDSLTLSNSPASQSLLVSPFPLPFTPVCSLPLNNLCLHF